MLTKRTVNKEKVIESQPIISDSLANRTFIIDGLVASPIDSGEGTGSPNKSHLANTFVGGGGAAKASREICPP